MRRHCVWPALMVTACLASACSTAAGLEAAPARLLLSPGREQAKPAPSPPSTTTSAPPPAAMPEPPPDATSDPAPDRATTTTSSSSSTTTTVAAAAPARQRIVVRATGDVSLDPFHSTGLAWRGHDHAWSGLDGLFLTDDVTIINLECAPSNLGWAQDKAYVFRCDPEALPVAAAHGVDVANLANNHSQDFGKEAMLDGRRLLLEAGILPVGAGENAAVAMQPALIEAGGWIVAVLGFSSVVESEHWFATTDRPGVADGRSTAAMVAAIQRASRVADLVFVTIHWGYEFEVTPRPEIVEQARAMIAAGADGIFGHHSHRLNPLEIVDGVPVAWSLGNFVWPRFSTDSATTAIAEVTVEPDGSTSARLIPAFIVESGHPVLVGE